MSLLSTATWAGTGSEVGVHVREQTARCLEAYRVNPLLIEEHFSIERATSQGGYGRRQIYELVQNGADALLAHDSGRIHVVLTEDTLYCANQGSAIDIAGVDALLSSHLSVKRGNEIGRFGLGFKSVLGVTDRPQFFSRSGSFTFNATYSRQQITRIRPDVVRVPVLRLATPQDPQVAARSDAVLTELMKWATSVVRVPLQQGVRELLAEDIRTFPAQFLLFSPHVGHLVLEDRGANTSRSVKVTAFQDRYLLADDDDETVWRIFRTDHTPSDDARASAGELADRKTLPVIWAVPVAGRSGRGQFWAFFPTEYLTTLSGIVNAPWKTNEDRQNLLRGQFNEELLHVAANLVVGALPSLAEPTDPGVIFDVLPARGRESPNWADAVLTESIYGAAAQSPSIPDQDGVLRLPHTLRVHPANAPREALEAWNRSPRRPRDWAHPSIETRERRPRADRLLGARAQTTYTEWLEALVDEESASASIDALAVAVLAFESLDPSDRSDLLAAAIVLTDAGDYVAPESGAVFLGVAAASSAEMRFVSQEVQSNPAALEALIRFGVGPVEAIGELKYLLAQRLSKGINWTQVWAAAARSHVSDVIEVFRLHDLARSVQVMTLTGTFRVITRTLLPGLIVPADASRDAASTIDLTYHKDHVDLLEALGAAAAPRSNGGSTTEAWFSKYLGEGREFYFSALPELRQRPQVDYIQFETRPFVGPLAVLEDLSNEGRERFTESVLAAQLDHDPWTLSHRSQRERYPRIPFQNPVSWLIQRSGQIATSLGPRQTARAVGRALERWSVFFPVAQMAENWEADLGLPGSLDALAPSFWHEALRQQTGVNDELLGAFYAECCLRIEAPALVRCREGERFSERPTQEVVVVTTAAELGVLAQQSTPVLLAPGDSSAEALIERWGLLAADTVIRTEVDSIQTGDPTPLGDEFPGLEFHLPPERRSLRLVRCSELRRVRFTDRGRNSTDEDFVIDGERLYWLEGPSDRDLLHRLTDEFQLGLTAGDIEDIAAGRADKRRRELLLSIRKHPDVESKLLAALPPDLLRRRLPASLLQAAGGNGLNDADLGRLALSVYGVAILREFRTELAERGLQPPSQWAGTRAARAFVRQMGFPSEFAGFEEAKRDPLVLVDGPPMLPPLHEFQQRVTENIRALLTDKSNKRGLLSLPTGAGKTRVAVQALVDALRDGELHGPLLWVAQTGELCEQAVQAWTEVWRSFGLRQPMYLSRLWAGNEAEDHEGVNVVVATIDKLKGCIQDPEYSWLSKAECVVIDEAHGSISPEYTALLTWLGLGRSREADRCPLIGLTATPFRGTSEEETIRLVRRYNERRLDAGSLPGDPYRTLQEMGVLARVRHKLLSGAEIVLSADELTQLRQTRRLPPHVEAALGEDNSRNNTILDTVGAFPEDWTALVFAASVEHAEILAALLSLRRVPAAAISAKTEPGARRHYVSEFRARRLRVLTNYGVLTEGFDAPAVRAVIVGRPTFSPNVYQQMIGRGLRGPLNGGKNECLIVNIGDNVVQFGESLAFTQFEHLWTPAEQTT